MILWIAFVLLILWMVHECRRLHQFNYEGQIQELQSLNPVVVRETQGSKNPLLIHNVAMDPVTLPELLTKHPGYILSDSQSHCLLDSFKDTSTMSLYRRPKLSHDLGFHPSLRTMGSAFESSMACHPQTDLSLFKGFHMIPLTHATHNVNLLMVLSGSCIVYLINPKHETEIQGQPAENLKKWSHRLVLKPHSLLSIPPNWFYIYECKGETVIAGYHSDTYGTYIYNALR